MRIKISCKIPPADCCCCLGNTGINGCAAGSAPTELHVDSRGLINEQAAHDNVFQLELSFNTKCYIISQPVTNGLTPFCCGKINNRRGSDVAAEEARLGLRRGWDSAPNVGLMMFRILIS